METSKKITVKWNGTEYVINDLQNSDTLQILKARIYEETGVRPDRQKLLNLKCKDDEQTIEKLNMKPGFKIMMMGSREEDIAEASKAPENMKEVINDLDTEQEEEVELENMEVHLDKIKKRIETYKVEVLNPPRENKKLLVLDIDYTLFDHRSVASSGIELMRPYLHEFLTRAYKHYDIVIWSATSMKWINEKMKLLGVTDNPNYKIAFHLDCQAMISVYSKERGLIDVKPLGVIWGKFPAYSPRNTIMFDDIRKNFIMNPGSGLKIKAFREAHLNRDKDTELLKLAHYLEQIADVDDFQTLDHRKWQDYKKK
ncbi:ubiquitin-like domain-containing CTD phosphatase 1 [Chelonus insularis]|uniref:ubiquitin-like domain-containing CTD phosphatase 1 n=1 Tax=Chelonus insularis TaxID=460826 RepID=UPI0015898370|nr:ubiquitin-like domain-containing CTD phosphatase 1 [Chelonus insularis]